MSLVLRPMGDAAWRIDRPPDVDAAAILDVLRSQPGIVDALVTDHHVLVRFDPARPPADPRAIIENARPQQDAAHTRHVIRVRYDGPDLDDVAMSCGLARNAVITEHTGRDYHVELVGFLPGFAYLGPLEGPLASVPRLPAPRPRVPALSVAIAAGRTAVYPFASPGGWRLLGTAVDFLPFDPTRGAVLRLGDLVRFEAA